MPLRGGEELLILLPHTGADAALLVAENLRARIEYTDFDAANCAIHVTASFGVSALDFGMETIHTLLEEADRAMYAAKKQGRNRAVSCADLDGVTVV